MKFAVVGAGFTGAVVAHELARAGHKIKLYEARSHLAGNCYTERDPKTGILLHKYGPHIFHTEKEHIWEFVNKYTQFIPYINRVKAVSQKQVYSLPINLHTINQYFKATFSPTEAKSFIESIAHKEITEPNSFEDQALRFVGKELYEAFFKGYTIKQWGIDPRELPASILKRLPMRFTYDDNYFNHKYQGMPTEGYTPIIENLLGHHNIEIYLNKSFKSDEKDAFDHVFYSGPIDGWFNYSDGRLGYRTLDFLREDHVGDYQGSAVINYSDIDVPYTRISEHKHFAPWETHETTVIFKEYSRKCLENDIPYYPIRLVNEKTLLKHYIEKAQKEKGVSFLGRLGTYRYLDMDVSISEALDASKHVLGAISNSKDIPPFFVDPT